MQDPSQWRKEKEGNIFTSQERNMSVNAKIGPKASGLQMDIQNG